MDVQERLNLGREALGDNVLPSKEEAIFLYNLIQELQEENNELENQYDEQLDESQRTYDYFKEEIKKQRQTIDFLKLKLVDWERHAEMIRRLADNKIIKFEAVRLKEDISDTLKAVEQQNS